MSSELKNKNVLSYLLVGDIVVIDDSIRHTVLIIIAQASLTQRRWALASSMAMALRRASKCTLVGPNLRVTAAAAASASNHVMPLLCHEMNALRNGNCPGACPRVACVLFFFNVCAQRRRPLRTPLRSVRPVRVMS